MTSDEHARSMARLMGRGNKGSTQKGKVAEPRKAGPVSMRWWGKLLLLLLSIALLTLSYAPFKQFYLAWIALVPWLMVLHRCRSARTAFFWSWVFGVGFFVANMWWLVYVTGPGMIALMVWLAVYWGAAGAIIRATGLLEPMGKGTPPEMCEGRAVASVVLIAAVWTALEWVRGTWPLDGLAWQYLGHSQSPGLWLCQIADFTGVYGISFCIMVVNAWVALFVLHALGGQSDKTVDQQARRSQLPLTPTLSRGERGQEGNGGGMHAYPLRRLLPAGIAVIAMLVFVIGYGVFRMSQMTTHAGPTVLIVQPNYPQSNSGEKGADQSEIVDFHVSRTQQALAKHPDVNLVVWSETMMPPLNAEAGRYTGTLSTLTDARLVRLAREDHTSILAGGIYYGDWTSKIMNGAEYLVPHDRRNAAYYFTPAGQSDLRYDKIHLVPFGEYLPFKETVPALYKLFLSMSPYPEEYTLTAGLPDALTVFPLAPNWRFVTPICFEDMDGELVRRMFKPGEDGRKRADFIANITNDGWFKYNEMPQHLQAAVFRSIENRAPTARSVNTGISGFIDSVGRTSGLIAPDRTGTSVATLAVDDRVTLYTRWGDVFAYICVAVTCLLIPAEVIRRQLRSKEIKRK